MNILFDLTEAQSLYFNGAAEYAQAVFLRIISQMDKYPGTKILCLYSSKRKFKYEQLSPEALKGTRHVEYVDYHGLALREIIKRHSIDMLFTPCAQAFCDLPLGSFESLGCKVVTVIHDLTDEELGRSHVQLWKHLAVPGKLFRLYLSKAKTRIMSGRSTTRGKKMLSLLTSNDAAIVTVSEYTRHSINCNYPTLGNKIHVFAAPEKEIPKRNPDIENADLSSLINSGKPFLLMVSCNRIMKNAASMVEAFKLFVQKTGADLVLATVGMERRVFKSHVPLPHLSASDLEHAYQNCKALLYPTLFEGFGYPPLEAMKYGKPVLCSNICSIPSILGSAPIYFSPLYVTEMYAALMRFSNEAYPDLCRKSEERYRIVNQKQQANLNELVSCILGNRF